MSDRDEKMLKQILDGAQKLGKYEIGETIEGLARKLGKKPSEILKLNSNENFFVPLDFLRGVLKEVIGEIDPRIYPREEPIKLKESLGRFLNVSPEEIVLGTGSDQLIDLVSRILLKTGDEALSISPTFSIYERCVRIQGAFYKAIPLKEDFSLDIEKILASVTPRTKLIFLCSPNNPTANQFTREEILSLTENFSGVVAVDEAYVDFSKGSIIDLVKKTGNLVVFRTFSKVFGLAGLRVGYAVANREFATVMDERFQMPYSICLIGLEASMKLLERIEVVKGAVEELRAERSKLIKMLNQIDGVHAFDSETNFVLFQVGRSSDNVYKELLKKGIILRNIGNVLRIENCLRVTVAPSFMMERFLIALKTVLGEKVA